MVWNQDWVGCRRAGLEMSKVRGQADPRIPATGRGFQSSRSFKGQVVVSVTERVSDRAVWQTFKQAEVVRERMLSYRFQRLKPGPQISEKRGIRRFQPETRTKDNEPGLSWVGTSAGLGSFHFPLPRGRTGPELGYRGEISQVELHPNFTTTFQLLKHLFGSILCLDFKKKTPWTWGRGQLIWSADGKCRQYRILERIFDIIPSNGFIWQMGTLRSRVLVTCELNLQDHVSRFA